MSDKTLDNKAEKKRYLLMALGYAVLASICLVVEFTANADMSTTSTVLLVISASFCLIFSIGGILWSLSMAYQVARAKNEYK